MKSKTLYGALKATIVVVLGVAVVSCSNPFSSDDNSGDGGGAGSSPPPSSDYTISASWSSNSNDGNIVSQGTEGSSALSPPASEIEVQTGPNQPPHRESGAVVVKYRADVVSVQSFSQKATSYGKVNQVFSRGDSHVSRIEVSQDNGKTVEETIDYFESLPEVEYAERDPYRYALGSVNDPLFSYQWNFAQLDMPSVWDTVTGEPSVVVAVIDTGVRQSLSDLADTNFVAGWDFVNDDDDPTDDNAHGSHVAGTVAQSTNNGAGVAGMAYDASIMPIKALGQDGSGFGSDVAAGIEWAVDNGADVINLSLGSSASSQTEKDAVEYAYSNGVAVIASSGNDNGAVGYPAAYESYVLAVGATRYDKQRAPYSNYGPELDVVAPGGDVSVDQNGDSYVDGILQQTIYGYDPDSDTTDYDSSYFLYQGTSMAAPHVAALAALLLSKNESLSPSEVYSKIEDSAEDLGVSGRDDYFGHGLINPGAALSLWRDSKSGSISHSEGATDTWELQAVNADSRIDVDLSFDVADVNFDLYLYDPAGTTVVAESTSDSSTENITYQVPADAAGTYTIEVRFVE